MHAHQRDVFHFLLITRSIPRLPIVQNRWRTLLRCDGGPTAVSAHHATESAGSDCTAPAMAATFWTCLKEELEEGASAQWQKSRAGHGGHEPQSIGADPWCKHTT
jgi:hypothetical protein